MNKFNIPVVINKLTRKGNFIDHYRIKGYIFKRRNINNDNGMMIFFGIYLEIKNKSRN